jgi:hypothetical protein
MAKEPGIFITFDAVRDVHARGNPDAFKGHICALIDAGYPVAVGATQIDAVFESAEMFTHWFDTTKGGSTVVEVALM